MRGSAVRTQANTARRFTIRRETRIALCFLAPSLVGMALLLLVPTLDVLRRAFLTAMGNTFAGFNNFSSVLQNSSFHLAITNTARFLGVCIPLLLGLSLLVALLLSKMRVCQSLLKTTYLLPLVVPVTSVVMIVQTVFHKNGLLSALCANFGMTPADWLNSEYAFYVLVACYIWKNLGYNVVLWLAGLSAIPANLYEAARIDGANEWQVFRAVTLPMLGTTAQTTAVLALINSFKVFREAYLVAGSYPHNSIYMLQHLLSNWFTNLDMQKISAAATLLLSGILLVMLLTRLAAWRRLRA